MNILRNILYNVPFVPNDHNDMFRFSQKPKFYYIFDKPLHNTLRKNYSLMGVTVIFHGDPPMETCTSLFG